MKIQFGNYTFFDGKTTGGTHVSTEGNFANNAFDEDKFNQLIANRQYFDAADYAAQFHFNDPETQKAHENDIINLRRNGRVLGAIYGRVQDPADLAKISFADNVFVDGGLERMEQNEYSKAITSEFEKYKSMIGSSADEEASTLAITFQPEKRTFLGLDFLAKDNSNNIDNFYAESGLSQQDLREAGIDIIQKDGKTTLKFDKSNRLANKILYYAPILPNGSPRIEGRIPVSITGFNKDGKELETASPGVFGTAWGYGDILNFKDIIDDARDVKDSFFGEIEGSSKDYSSTIAPLISDELSALKDALSKGEITATQYNQQARAMAPNVFSAIYSLGSANYEMYTNKYNKKPTDETLIPANNEQRGELINLISNYDPKDMELSAMVSNGKIGTLITLKGTGSETEGDKNDGQRYQIFVPGLLQEEAQAKINRNTSSRAVQELNSMLDWGYDYKLRDGSAISINSEGYFKKGDKVIDKEQAIREINKDMIMEDALSNLKYQYMNSDGNIIDNLKYENMSRLLAMDTVQDLYNDIKVNINPQTEIVNISDKFGNIYDPDDIFNHNIDKETTQYEIYDRFNEIYAIYNELMNELNYYK